MAVPDFRSPTLRDLIKAADCHQAAAQTGVVTLIQRFGSPLNLNIHLMCMDARMPRAHGCAGAAHMLFLDGVYVTTGDGLRFRRVPPPTVDALSAWYVSSVSELAARSNAQDCWCGTWRIAF